jgi:uncharacterized protein (DUF302 family)
MSIVQVPLERFSVTSSKSFESVLQSLEAQFGHPDMSAFLKTVASAKDFKEIEDFIHRALGPSGLMLFTRFNIGDIIRKERGPSSPRIVRLVVGNPLIVKQMVVHVPEAAAYGPVSILVDERPDGVHLSYDRMASLLAPYGSNMATRVAEQLDAKVEGLLESAA